MMSYQEKKNVISLVGTSLIFTLYCMYIIRTYPEESLTQTDNFSFWGSAILLLIPLSIVIKIIIHIVFSIINAIATNEKEPKFTDELDKLIELKATRNSHYVFAIGTVLAMGALAIDQPPNLMFIIFILSGFLSEVAGYISQLYLYRKGV